MRLFLSDESERHLARLKDTLPHACILEGPEGIGLRTIALELAGERLNGIIEPTDIKGNVDYSSSGFIRVTQIRELATRAINKSRGTRIYLIDNADQMNHQAQNAFLKLLEEPAPHVHFILLSHHVEKILPTILSRVQTLRLPTISAKQSNELLDLLKIHDVTTRAQLLFLAEGLPAELTRLATDTELFSSKVAFITTARTFLQGTFLEKCMVINTYSANRPQILEVLSYAERILKHSLKQQPTPDLITRANMISDTYDAIASNANIRIQLLRLVL